MPLLDTPPQPDDGAWRGEHPTTQTAIATKSDKRRGQRHRTFRGATIVYGDDLLTLDCTVHDQSGGGLMIELPPLTLMPDRFFLVVHHGAFTSDVRIRWRRENMAGLEVLGQSDVDARTSAPLRVLRGIWVEKEPRSGLPSAAKGAHDDT